MRAILVGGTSHVGKSTFAAQLANRLGWDVMSTDRLARHPGRPWRDGGDVPAHVRDHFSARSDDALLEEVTRHYKENVWPIVEAIVRARISNPFDDCLVIEGSAILPHCVATAKLKGARAVWLTVPDVVIVQRIQENSSFVERPVADGRLIEKFLSRTLAFNRYLLTASESLGKVVDVSDDSKWNEALEELAAEVWAS